MSEYKKLYTALSRNFLSSANDEDIRTVLNIRDKLRTNIHNILEEISNIIDMISTIKMNSCYISINLLDKKFIKDVEMALKLSNMDVSLSTFDSFKQNFEMLSHYNIPSSIQVATFFEKYLLAKDIFEAIYPPDGDNDVNIILMNLDSTTMLIDITQLSCMVVNLKMYLKNLEKDMNYYMLNMDKKIRGKI